MSLPTLRRPRAGVALALVLLAAGGVATAGVANAAESTCTTPGISNGNLVEGGDSNVNVFVGGDFTVQSGAEAEGVVVVDGNLSVNHFYNVGVAGVGSRVTPDDGSVMLRVGGDVSGSDTVDVGSGLPHGGAALVGGTSTGVSYENNGATTTTGVGHDTALGSYTTFEAGLAPSSTTFAALTDTGTVAYEGWRTTLDGDGTSAQQVFTLDLDQYPSALGNSAGSVQVLFKDIPASATVIVNVVGSSVHTNVNGFADGPAPADVLDPTADSQGLAHYASHTLWNFEDATNPVLGGGAQWAGSILVPNATGTTTISLPGTNGRVYVAGNLVHAGSGTEFHSYPFVGSPQWTCSTDVVTPAPTETTTPSTGTEASPAPTDTPTTDAPVTDAPVTDAPTETPTAAVDQPTAPGETPTTSVDATDGTATVHHGDDGDNQPTTQVDATGGTATAAHGDDADNGNDLAETGASVLPFAVAALVAIAAGVGLIVVRRRAA